MRAIVAVDKNWGIGRNNGLLFSIPEDMKFFRTVTAGKTVVMGAKTLDSFPGGRPLKNRVNIVLTRGADREGCVTVHTEEEALAEIKKYPCDDVYLIGGAAVYKLLLPYCTEALVTKVEADGNAQVFFENLDNMPTWRIKEEGEALETEGGLKIKFTTYTNLQIKEL